MTCDECLPLLSARLDRELDVLPELTAAQRSAIEAHLETCASCQAVADAIQQQDGELRQVFAERRQAVGQVVENTITQLAERREARQKWSGWWPTICSLAAGFLIAAVLFNPWEKAATNPDFAQLERDRDDLRKKVDELATKAASRSDIDKELQALQSETAKLKNDADKWSKSAANSKPN